MKELLQQQGWKCNKCSCPGPGDDCAHPEHRGYVIKLRGTTFRIFKSGLSIASGHNYQLTAKLKEHEIYKETI